MALSRTNLFGGISNSLGTFGTGAYTSSSFTPPSSSLLVAFISAIENGGATNLLTDLTISDTAGLTWAQRVSQGVATSFSTASAIWTAPVTTGTSMTMSADCGTRDISEYTMSIVGYTGYDLASPIGATGSNSQNGGFSGPPDPASVTLSGSPAATSEVFAGVGLDSGSSTGVTVDPGSGWTEIYDVRNQDWGGGQTQVRSGSTSTSVAWDNLRNGGGGLFNYAAVAVEVKEAAAGPPNVIVQLTKAI